LASETLDANQVQKHSYYSLLPKKTLNHEIGSLDWPMTSSKIAQPTPIMTSMIKKRNPKL